VGLTHGILILSELQMNKIDPDTTFFTSQPLNLIKNPM